MTDFGLGVSVSVDAPAGPVFAVSPPGASSVQVVPVAGPQGPPGVSPSNTGQPRWAGQGPPGTIIGAAPGDLYLDETSGLIYTLT